jgi:hypothetical protein
MSRFLSRAIVSLSVALGIVLATTVIGVAGPAALIEKIIGRSGVAEVMAYADTGRTIRLGSDDTIVLTYLDSCIQETITGGTVIIGVNESQVVQASKLTRTKLDCPQSMFVLTGHSTSAVAGRVIRGSNQR